MPIVFRLQRSVPLALNSKDEVDMFFDGGLPKLAKTATDIAVVGMFMNKNNNGKCLLNMEFKGKDRVLRLSYTVQSIPLPFSIFQFPSIYFPRYFLPDVNVSYRSTLVQRCAKMLPLKSKLLVKASVKFYFIRYTVT